MGLALSVFKRGGFADVVSHFKKVAAYKGQDISDDEAYRKIVAVHVCVQKISRNIASMPLCISTADDRILESGPLVELLDTPNPMMSGEGFIHETCGWLELTGRVHWLFDQGEYRGGRPRRIDPVGAGQMKPITDGPPGSGRGYIEAWLYREAGQRWDQARRVELDAVWTIRNPAFDPDRPYEGLSPAQVVRRAIAQVYKADIANESSLDNGVEPGGALIHKGGLLSDPQRKALRDELTERHAGPQNRRRPLTLLGDWDWKQISSSFSDMEFSQLKLISRGEICAAFDLPHAALFEPSNGSSSEYVDKAIEMIWTDATIPRANRLAAEIDRGIVSKFEGDTSMRMHRSVTAAKAMRHHAMRITRAGRSRRGNLYAWFDASSIDAMKKLMTSRIETAVKMVEGLYETPAHAGALMDLGLSDNDAQQLVWQKTSAMPFGQASSIMTQPPEDEPEVEPEEDEPGDGVIDDERSAGHHHLRLVFSCGHVQSCRCKAPKQTKHVDRPCESCGAGDVVMAHIKALTPAQLEAMQDSWFRSWQPIADQLAGTVRSHFFDLYKQVMANVSRLSTDKSIERRDLIGQLLFNLVGARAALSADAAKIITAAFQLGGDQIRQQKADADGVPVEDINPFGVADPRVAEAIRTRVNMMAAVNDTAYDRLKKKLVKLQEAGEPISKMGEAAGQVLKIDRKRAMVTARTEIGASVEKANHLSREQNGIPSKSWLSSRKATSRDNHSSVERATLSEPIPLSQRFAIPASENSPGGTCMHPRDTSLPAGEVVNCACTTISRFPDDTLRDARLIQSLVSKGWLNRTMQTL